MVSFSFGSPPAAGYARTGIGTGSGLLDAAGAVFCRRLAIRSALGYGYKAPVSPPGHQMQLEGRAIRETSPAPFFQRRRFSVILT